MKVAMYPPIPSWTPVLLVELPVVPGVVVIVSEPGATCVLMTLEILRVPCETS